MQNIRTALMQNITTVVMQNTRIVVMQNTRIVFMQNIWKFYMQYNRIVALKSYRTNKKLKAWTYNLEMFTVESIDCC